MTGVLPDQVQSWIQRRSDRIAKVKQLYAVMAGVLRGRALALARIRGGWELWRQ